MNFMKSLAMHIYFFNFPTRRKTSFISTILKEKVHFTNIKRMKMGQPGHSLIQYSYWSESMTIKCWIFHILKIKKLSN